MKTPYKRPYVILSILFMTIFSPAAFAEIFHWSKACEHQKFVFENKTSKPQTVWLQKWNQTLHDESDYTVQAHAYVEIELKNDLTNSFQDYSLLITDHSLKNEIDFSMHTKCLNTDFENNSQIIEANSTDGGILQYQIGKNKNIELEVKNLTPSSNDVYILEFDLLQNNISSKTLNLKSRENINLKISLQKNTTFIKVFAQGKFSGFVSVNTKLLKPITVEVQKTLIDTNAHYFLLAPRSVNDLKNSKEDQFVVKITDPKMVEKARDQIRNKKLEKIVFGKIVLGHQGFNRNFAKKNKSFWNWSVSEVTNISDLGSTACNGFPQLLEDRSEFWVNDPGNICFWNYRIKRELTVDEVSQ